MALETKLAFVNVDKTGRVITVKDSTGNYDSTTNPGGYGSPNPLISNITDILFTVNQYESKHVDKVRFVRTSDPNHPEYMTVPSVDDIASGTENVELTSVILGITEAEDGLKAFPDSVYDLNMYTIYEELDDIVADKGTNIVTRVNGGLDVIYSVYDYIIIENIPYTIDKSVSSDPNQLTLDSNIQETGTVFYPAYRANTKAFNQAGSDCCGVKTAGKISECDCSCNDSKYDNLFLMWMYKISAQIDFNCHNYKEANDLLQGAQRICKKLNCKC